MKKRVRKEKNVDSNTKKPSKNNHAIFLIPLRYLILLAFMFTLPWIYLLLTPITLYSAASLLKLIYNNVVVYGNAILINSNIVIEVISACVAGSAYLLLLILNLAVPMNLKKRIGSIFLSFIILFVFNILRIFLFSILFKNNSYLFDFTHKLFWYFLSTIFVVLIWFFIVKIFSIKEIPVYSDIKYLIKVIKK